MIILDDIYTLLKQKKHIKLERHCVHWVHGRVKPQLLIFFWETATNWTPLTEKVFWEKVKK